MKSDRAIERYNRLLLRDLGSNPVYSWKWSEDLLHVMQAVDRDGKPEMEAVRVGAIFAVKQATRVRKLAPDLTDQWVICALIELSKEDGQIHGTGIASWMPVRDKRSRAVALPQGTHPNQYATEDFVQQMRRIRLRDAEEMGKWEEQYSDKVVPLDETEKNSEIVSRHEAKKFAEMKAKIKDEFTAFGEEPGKKGGTSFPEREPESYTAGGSFLVN